MHGNPGGPGVCSVKWSRSGERRDFIEWNLNIGLEEADVSADSQWVRARKEGGMGEVGRWVLLHLGASISGVLLHDAMTVDHDDGARGV